MVGKLYDPAALPAVKNPGTHLVGGRVDPTVCPDLLEKIKISCLTTIRTPARPFSILVSNQRLFA